MDQNDLDDEQGQGGMFQTFESHYYGSLNDGLKQFMDASSCVWRLFPDMYAYWLFNMFSLDY